MCYHPQYLNLDEFQGVKQDTFLNNIGQVNVICGKNNSGKTSILEAIFQQRTKNPRNIFFKLDQRALNELVEIIINYNQYSIPCYVDNAIPRIFKNFVDQCKSFEYWLGFSLVKLSQFINKYGGGISQGNIRILHSLFQKFFQSKLDNIDFEPFLIPAKRTVINNPAINVNTQVKENGEGLTNNLFFLKNRDFHSNSHKLFNVIYDAFHQITGVYFNVFISTEKDNSLRLEFSHDAKKWRHYLEWGMGLVDVLIILWFSVQEKYAPLLIEEPESHVHPEMQRKLLDYLKHNTDKQYFFTTHSNVFLDPSLVDRIIYTEMKDSVQIHDVMPKAEILKNLGYSITDNICADLFLIVEGPSDIPVFRHLFDRIGISKHYQISIFFLGGGTMQYCPFDDFLQIAPSDKIFVITDKDPKSNKAIRKTQEICEANGISFKKLKRYAIENYLTISSLQTFYYQHGTTIPTFKIQKNEKLSTQIERNDNSLKDIPQKRHVSEIFKFMTDEELEQTEDLYDFCLKIKSKLESA